MKKDRVVFTILASLFALVTIYFGVIFLINSIHTFDYETGSTLNEYKEYKSRVLYSEKYMPNIENIPNVKEFKTSYAKRFMPLNLMSTTESVTLTCIYQDEVNYLFAKDSIHNDYQFLNETNSALYDISAQVNGYDIRVVDENSVSIFENSYLYPHSFLMVGFNDELFQLTYMFHYDSELDYIDNLDKFIKESYYLI